MRIIGEPKNVIADHVDPGILYPTDCFKDVIGSKPAFFDTVPDVIAA